MTFEDLINGLSVLNQKATREQKLMLSFHLLDPEGTGYITKKMTTDVLRSCLAECRGMFAFILHSSDVCVHIRSVYSLLTSRYLLLFCDNAELEISLSEEQIARIVNSTFDEADLDRNGLIDINEYHVSPRKIDFSVLLSKRPPLAACIE